MIEQLRTRLTVLKVRRLSLLKITILNSRRQLNRKYGQIRQTFRICHRGSGPAGFYMAKNLIKPFSNCNVYIFDRNPHPFGLIRTGVAPDHQAMKKIEKDFSTVLDDSKVSFFWERLAW